MPIRNLTRIDSLQAGDVFGVGSLQNGDDRGAAVSVLQAYLEDNMTITDAAALPNYISQYAAPSATGFNVQVNDASNNVHLILTPVTGYAAGTITLPQSVNLIDKQEVLVNCTQAVTTLVVDGNGATVAGEPATLAANDFFRLRYDLPGNTWYRVG